MASIRDTLAGLFAKESPSAIQGTPLGNAYPGLAQPEQPLEAPFLSPDDLIGTGIGKAALAGGAKLAPLLMGTIKPLINTHPLVNALKNVSIQDKAFSRLANNYPEMVQQYGEIAAKHADTNGGRILNTDSARELFPEYQANRTLSAEVHEPASTFIKKLYQDKLANPTPEGLDPHVVFTAGGTGAGKTSAMQSIVKNVPEINRAEMVYDTNMNTFHSADQKMQDALKSGRKVTLLYTYRDPVDALINGALPRAIRMEQAAGSGRTVPLSEHLKTHVGSRNTIEELATKYKNDPNVNIHIIDNSLGKNIAPIETSLDKLPQLEENVVKENLKNALEQQKNNISPAIYSGTKDY